MDRKKPWLQNSCTKSVMKKNCLQNGLTVLNIQVGKIVSNTFVKSAQAILDKLLENFTNTSFDLNPLIYKRSKKKSTELRELLITKLHRNKLVNLKRSKLINTKYTEMHNFNIFYIQLNL